MNGLTLVWCLIMGFAWHVHGVNAVNAIPYVVDGVKVSCEENGNDFLNTIPNANGE